MATPASQEAGVLPVDKPVGPTSHDAVAIARRALGIRRIGHTGTLDPFASGLLLLCVGSATRISEYLTALPKTYDAVLGLGVQTDTHDHTGTVTARSEDWRQVSSELLARALGRRAGKQWQVPPGHSAKKVGGERLYAKARRGEAVKAAPAMVEIMEIGLTAWEPPHASFRATVSSGTYIRAIARDVGAELGCYAHLVELRRTAIGSHQVSDALPLDRLQAGDFADYLLDPLAALPHLPRLALDDGTADAIRHGQPAPAPPGFDAPLALLVWRGALLAVAAATLGWLHPRKVFDA